MSKIYILETEDQIRAFTSKEKVEDLYYAEIESILEDDEFDLYDEHGGLLLAGATNFEQFDLDNQDFSEQERKNRTRDYLDAVWEQYEESEDPQICRWFEAELEES